MATVEMIITMVVGLMVTMNVIVRINHGAVSLAAWSTTAMKVPVGSSFTMGVGWGSLSP